MEQSSINLDDNHRVVRKAQNEEKRCEGHETTLKAWMSMLSHSSTTPVISRATGSSSGSTISRPLQECIGAGPTVRGQDEGTEGTQMKEGGHGWKH